MNGSVRFWSSDEGWGVIDSTETPGGCWVHFSAVETAGLRELRAGQDVAFEYEGGDQDGYSFRAVSVRPGSSTPARERSPVTDGGAYRSTLSVAVERDPPARPS
jgi:Cold shock proteins